MSQQNVTDTTELNIVLQVQEINAIMAALQELPAKVANPLTNKLMEQARAQVDKLNGEIKLDLSSGASTQESFS